MKPRILYEVDPHNRLVIKKTGKGSEVKRFRQVVYGRFKTDPKNRLYYEVTKADSSDIPQKIEFSGAYSLDKKHNLIYTLDKWNNQCVGNRLQLKTGIVDASDREMIFLVSSREAENKKHLTMMKLYGSWRVDENNRLTFGVKKEGDERDTLTLFNAWKISKNNEIEYNYGRENRILFKGSWDIKDKNRISYVLNKDIGSGFNFHASLGRIIPKEKNTYARFDVEIDISKTEKITRNIIFSCRCILNRQREILLEISPGKNKEVVLKLTKKILKDQGMAYIESFIKGEERYLGGGLAFRW